MELWNVMKEIFSTVADISIFLITVYTFYITVFPKLRFLGISHHFSMFDGDSMTISLENRSLSPISIKEVDLILDDYKITFFNKKDAQEECIVDGFKTIAIRMEPFSEIKSEDDGLNIITSKPRYIKMVTSRRTQYIKINRKQCASFLKRYEKRNKLKQTMVIRNLYNGLLVKPHIKYALSYLDDKQEIQTLLISENGILSGYIFGFNVIPTEHLTTEDSLRDFFKNFFKDKSFTVQDFYNKLKT